MISDDEITRLRALAVVDQFDVRLALAVPCLLDAIEWLRAKNDRLSKECGREMSASSVVCAKLTLARNALHYIVQRGYTGAEMEYVARQTLKEIDE